MYEEIKNDVQFASISGGTDLNGCFALGCTNLPGAIISPNILHLNMHLFLNRILFGSCCLSVYDGELQIRGLGLDVHMFSDDGKAIIEEQGELVCKKPFPSMPLYFWDDASGSKYFDACKCGFSSYIFLRVVVLTNIYDLVDFDMFPNIWRHGDFAKVTKHGGVVISGRSDATLKPGAHLFLIWLCVGSCVLRIHEISTRWCANWHG